MSGTVEQSIHEVDFCGAVASAANILFAQDPTAFPFGEARLEGFGRGAAKRKRKDLRFFEQGGHIAKVQDIEPRSVVTQIRPHSADGSAAPH